MPTVSIVIPAKDEEKHIATCLEATMKLNYPSHLVDVHVVDNGSSDQTVEIARQFGVTVHERVPGTIGAVRNYGARISKGEIIGFLDGDCIADRDWISTGLRLMAKAPGVSAVGFVVAPPGDGASWVERCWYVLSSTSKLRGTAEVHWLSSFNILVKREYFEGVAGFSEDLATCEDTDFSVKLGRISKLLASDEICINHLGGTKTLGEFWRKEKWRARGAARVSSGKRGREYLGTWGPSAFVLLALGIIPLMLLNPFLGIALAAIVLAGPVAFIMKKARQGSVTFRNFCPLWLLAFTYITSRGVAVLCELVGGAGSALHSQRPTGSSIGSWF